MSIRRTLAGLPPLRFAYHLLTRPRATIEQVVRQVKRDGVFHDPSDLYMASLEPRALWEEVLKRYRPETLLDVGCGVGRTVDYFLGHGVDAWGIEASDVAIKHAKHPERILELDLRKGPFRHPRAPFGLVWCYEVAEHIHAKFADSLIETLCVSGERILLSAAQPGQGGVGHLNEQPPSYWRLRLERRGFALDAGGTAAFQALPDRWARNVQIFERVRDSKALSNP